MSLKRKVALTVAGGMLASAVLPLSGLGASHREAPNILKDPTADSTDLYAFVSPDAPDTVTLIANYLPFQEPNGGPYFYPFDPDVLYAVHVDNDGDGESDIDFEWRFETEIVNPDTFLYSTNTIMGADYENLNVRQTYTLTMNGEEIGSGLAVPPANVGPRSTPDYESLAMEAVEDLDNGIRAFAGQRDDPFFIDIGAIFDLGGLRPFNDLHLVPLPVEPGIDSVGSFNVNSLVLQVPINMLTNDGEDVSAPDADNAVIGLYTSASRQSMSVLSLEEGAVLEGDWVQVSRMGNPLINEVVIPVGEKDFWNRSDPVDDSQFVEEYSQPEVSALVNLLYPATEDVDEMDRSDLVLILLQGVPGLNSTGEGMFDLLRLNMGIPPSDSPSRLGVLEGDLAGFPNGRRVWDDVTDIEIRAFAQGYGEFLAENFGLPNKSPNNLLGDGCDANDVTFKDSFPYVATPHQGYSHAEHHQTCTSMPPTDTGSYALSSGGGNTGRTIAR
ncbi:DUF4331 domain-containing protein [soil metagenome]